MTSKSLSIRNIVLLLLLISFAVSCTNQDELFYQFKSTESSNWNKDKLFDFAVEVSDTSGIYDVFVEIRNTDQYKFRNLWLFVSNKTPEGNSKKDTINCELADMYGKWYGKGSNHYTLVLPLDQNIRFRIPGTYIYSVRQGMREENLKGITDVGLRIAKHTNN